MHPLLVLSAAFHSPRLRRALQRLGRETSALLDALTSPVQFVAEVEALRQKPGRAQQA